MPTLEQRDKWLSTAAGRYMNPDNAYGYQCKDVADDYCVALFGNWVNTIKPGNGKDVFKNASSTYFTKIANNPKDPNHIPEKGDIINWGASKAVPEGHVAVVVSATPKGVTVIEQDGYKQTKAKKVTHPYLLPSGAMVIGWLRPKWDKPKPVITTKEIKEDKAIPYETKKTEDPTLPKGEYKITQVGVPGIKTTIYTVTYSDGKETSRKVKSESVTRKPQDELVSIGTYIEPTKDQEQDERISKIESLLQKIVDFLTSIFTGFKK